MPHTPLVSRAVSSLFFYFIVQSTIAQVANFSSDKTSGCSPLIIQFSDLSTGTNSSTTYLWTFGNGNVSNDKNPSAQYITPGTYTVTLKVTNGSTSDTETKTAYITVQANPIANFSFTPSAGCAPLAVSFSDLSAAGSGSLVEREWVFGDGTTSNVLNPTHTYSDVNTYSVTLRVKNQFGCQDTESKSSVINVTGPSASFTVSDDDFCSSPALVQFTNTSVETEPLTYHWNFGDGQTAISKNATHTFNSEGTFNVVLTATNSVQCSDTFTHTITVGGSGGVDFSASKTEICTGEMVWFTASFPDLALSKSWDFGDGSSSTELNPSHQFLTPGDFAVTLSGSTISNPCVRVTKIIKVSAPPTANFSFSGNCSTEIKFTNASVSSTSWQWSFGDGTTSTAKEPTHLYGAPGNYPVTLTSFNSKGCQNAVTKTVSVASPPVAAFSPFLTQDCEQPTLSGCAPFTIALTNMSSGGLSAITESKWTFGDGATSTSTDGTHTYLTAGTFQLTLEIKNAAGCTGKTTKSVIVSSTTPVADFTADKVTVCVDEPVNFSGNPTVNGNYFCWDTGDGNRPTGKEINHSYSQPGVYSVTLKAKNAGCENSKTKTTFITVLDPFPSMSVVKTCTDPFHVDFINASTGFDSYVWDFGDGTTSTSTLSPGKTYTTEGTYNASLTVSSSSTGCVVKRTATFKIQQIDAAFNLSETNPCLGEFFNLTDKSKSAVRWQWNFDDGSSNVFTQHAAKAYNVPGIYDVKLTAFDSDGCSDDYVAPVEVLDVRGDFTFDAVSHCDYLSVDFIDASVVGSGLTINDWKWDFGDQQNGAGQNISHEYQDEGVYTVKLTLTTDGLKECSATRFNVINFQTPIPSMVIAKPGFCIGETVNLYNTSTNANTYLWEFPDGTSSEDFHTNITFDQEGQYDIKLTATDASGCSKTLTNSNYIKITKPDASFTARETEAECPPLISYFTNESTDAATYQWTFGDGQSSSVQSPVNTYLRPGRFDVKLIATDANGCTDTETMDQVVNVGGPDGTFTVGPLTACVGDELTFTAASTNTVTHRWDFGDGIVQGVEPMTTTHKYDTGTTAFISLVLIDANGCEVPALGNYAVQIYNNPQIGFSYQPRYPFEHETISLQAISDAPNISWFTEGIDIPTGLFTQVTYDTAGTKSITLSALNDAGCATDSTFEIHVQGDIELFNVFTPNNDDYNEAFVVRNVEEGNWFLTVFDRWGGKVYEQRNYQNQWTGANVSAGVYFYTIINQNRPDKFYRGTVSIRK